MKRSLQISLLALITLALSACIDNNQEVEKKSLTVSILPQKYFIEALAGDIYNINVMVTPGASPASYEPTPRQMAMLSNSELYFMIGHLVFEEVWIPRITKINPDLKVIDLSSGIKLIGVDEENIIEHKHATQDVHSHHGIDPHIWMSPKQAKQILNWNRQKKMV